MKIFLFILGAGVPVLFSGCYLSMNKSTSYYFDSSGGNDLNSGTSPGKAFQSLARLREISVKPGDSILLKSGAVFREQLFFSGKGDSLHRIHIGKYGGDALPHIAGDGKTAAVHILNSEFIAIRDLEISNKGTKPVNGLNGLLFELNNYGVAKDITIERIFVHDVFGSLIKQDGGGNAILMLCYHDEKPDSVLSCFDGLTIQDCHVRNCQRNGIMMWGNWIRSKWFPSRNVIIRNNLIEGVPGDGIVPVACESPLVEHNVMKDCPDILPVSEACDGIWPWSCDNALVQYNVVSGHKSKIDGYSFDSDWNSTNTLIRYNLSFNNYGGFLLACDQGGWTSDWNIGNTGTHVSYNISINDGIRNYIPEGQKSYFSPLVHVSGPVFNMVIEKNIFFLVEKENPETDKTFIRFTSMNGFADSTLVKENFLYLPEPHLSLSAAGSTRNMFLDNFCVGKISGPDKGFVEKPEPFNRSLWYDKNDENWDRLIEFAKDKSVNINGIDYKVLDILGYTTNSKEFNSIKQKNQDQEL